MNVTDAEVDKLYKQLKERDEKRFYFFNKDVKFTKQLIRGMLINLKRYGYLSCPCRLATGNRKKDLDIICPCDYRDIDLTEFGACYCALYTGKKFKNTQVPERRNKFKGDKMEVKTWRCKVCGYLCARESPPDQCPICGVDADRFEEFELK